MSEAPQTPATGIPRPKPWLTWIMSGLFILGILFWWIGDRSLNYARGVVAVHYAEQAQEDIAQKNWTAAGRNLHKARSWRVDHPRVLRAYADLLTATHSDPLSLLPVLRSLDALQQATPQDRIQIGQILIALGHIDAARQEYEKLPTEQRESRDSLELLADLLRAEGHVEEAEKLLRRALAMAPDDPRARLRLAILDHQNSFPEIQARSRQILWELAEGQDDTALRALEFLSTQAEVNGEAAERLLTLIDAHPEAQAKIRYAALSARLRARPQDRAAMVEAEVERVRDLGVEALAPALNWLILENQPERVIELLPDQIYLKSGQLLHPYLQALSTLKRWQEIDQLLRTQRNLPVSATYLHLWKARAAEKLEAGMSTVRLHLEGAFAQTGRGQDEMAARMTAEVAEQMGQWDLASRFYQEIAELQPLSQVPMLEKVHEMALRVRDTNSALRSARQLAQLHPENHTYSQRAMYLSLVAGHEVELTVQTLQEEKKDADFPLLRALAAYRLGDLDQVREHLTAIQEMEDLPPGQKAVHAGLLAACQQVGPAYRLAESVPSLLLLPEELRFLKRAL